MSNRIANNNGALLPGVWYELVFEHGPRLQDIEQVNAMFMQDAPFGYLVLMPLDGKQFVRKAKHLRGCFELGSECRGK